MRAGRAGELKAPSKGSTRGSRFDSRVRFGLSFHVHVGSNLGMADGVCEVIRVRQPSRLEGSTRHGSTRRGFDSPGFDSRFCSVEVEQAPVDEDAWPDRVQLDSAFNVTLRTQRGLGDM